MFSSSALKLLPFLFSLSLAASDNVWDYAPDFSKDEFPPYPSLKNPDGSNITIENVRGTHLFGWKGCQTEEVNAIQQAYNDFYTLAQQPEVYNNIDWNSKAAVDIWGPASGDNVVRDDTRKEIQQIFAAAQQVYSYQWTWQPPWLSWRQLWIEVRCSDSKEGKDSSDPTNRCGDAKKPPRCGNGKPPVGGASTLVEAFSDPDPDDSKYSRITFCNGFFNLQTFKDAVDAGKKLPAAQKTNLEKWNNRARCFFHEVTHLDYFMNAGDTSDPNDKSLSPYVSDLECEYKDKDEVDWHESYGVYDIKVLRNWVDPDPTQSGYFPQRNADSYAYFALAKYVEKQIGKYPSSPSPGRKKPVSEPRDSNSKEPPRLSTKQGQDVDLIDGDEQDRPDDVQFPGCGDKIPHPTPHDAVVSSISSEYAPSATPTAGPQADPKCDTHALSNIPYNVFDGKEGSVFTKFCEEVNKDEKKKLDWNVDASGNEKTTKKLRFKRTPPPNPKAYDSTFELHWAPASGSCNTKCDDAYSRMALSPCGHQGGQQNIMAASTSLDVGCGTYSYKVTGDDVPAVEGPPEPFVTAQYCYPSDVFGDHGDIQGDSQAQFTGFACANSANINMKPGDKSNFNTTRNGVPYNYNIWWKDGCESSVNPMNVYQPLESNKDANCLDLMQHNYKDCKNGGIGGIISVGCLNYEFKASLGPVGVAS